MSDLDIRRPDLKDASRRGTVRWFKDEKGYGRITADDGAEASSTTDATSPRTSGASPSVGG
jgi:hypothetical protein